MRFPLGQIVATPGALRLCAELGLNPAQYIRRHAAGDWGDIDTHDRRANDAALKQATRLLSAYKLPNGAQGKVWVITEADRSSTTILLPEEY